MARSGSHVDVAVPTGGSYESLQGAEFLQQRLGLFAGWNCILGAAFIPLRLAGELWLAPAQPVTALLLTTSLIAHVLASAVAGVVWLIMRGAPRPLQTSRAIDAALIITVGALFATMGATLTRPGMHLVSQPPVAMYIATLAVSFTMVWHAAVVPLSPRRAAVVTAIGVTPLAVADLLVLPGSAPGGRGHVTAVIALGWAALSIVTAAVISSVIYGLRREVQRARRLGQYTLDEKIGEGAMGIVYRASHAMLRRPTAIKLLPPSRSGALDLQRFEREVQLTAMLTHPNTVAIYDYGRTPDGVFYYAMEYLDGITLEDLVRSDGPQPSGRVIHILRQVCRALAEAHALGVIHRDIKPANVILTTRGGEPDVAKVVDFGLVKRVDSGRTDLAMSLDG